VNAATSSDAIRRAAGLAQADRSAHADGKAAGAVIVGGDYQGLGIARGLGEHGVPICIVDDEHSIGRFSRYCTYFEKVENLRDEQKTISLLMEIGERLKLHGWVLYPTRDEHVAAFSRNRTRLQQIFRVATTEWESVEWAWDKRNTYRLAAELQIPIPLTKYPASVDELRELDSATPPFALKPAIKENFVYAAKAKAWRADSHEQLKDLYQKASAIAGAGEIMVQEFIPGGGSQQFAYCAFFHDGRAIGKMVVRRRRQHPLQFGKASTYVETVDVPIIEEYSERFLNAIHYYGLVEVEFKLDPRDSQYKLLDVNARTWGYHSLGARFGSDFSYMLYADQVGIPVVEKKVPAGKSWMRATTDFPTAILALIAGELDLKSYFRSLLKCDVDAVFSFGDPLPGVAELLLVPYLAVRRGF
jgi:D-aspartate ligase